MNYQIKPFKTIKWVDRFKIVFPNTNFIWDKVFDTKEECIKYAKQAEKEMKMFPRLYDAMSWSTQRITRSLLY